MIDARALVPEARSRRVNADVVAILAVATVDDHELRLAEALPRAVYARVRQVIQLAGGKWDGRCEAHVEVDRHERCDVRLDWSIEDSRGEIFRFAPRFNHAPGPEGVDDYTTPYETSCAMSPGPATMRITMEARCPGNYLQALAQLVMELPDVFFTVLPGAS